MSTTNVFNECFAKKRVKRSLEKGREGKRRGREGKRG
jgi:hypothetical protein